MLPAELSSLRKRFPKCTVSFGTERRRDESCLFTLLLLSKRLRLDASVAATSKLSAAFLKQSPGDDRRLNQAAFSPLTERRTGRKSMGVLKGTK